MKKSVNGVDVEMSSEEEAEMEAMWSEPPDIYVPQSITRRQLLLALMGAGIITSAEAIAAAQTGAAPAAAMAVFDQLQEPDRSAAYITWASMSVAKRDNSLVAALAQAQGMDAAAVDALFIAAYTL